MERSVAAQITILQWVKRHSPVPVTTGQIWSDWRDHPELASAVDFIGAHILPYWEGAPASQAVEWGVSHYDELRRDYPGKRIVVAEFGWPSAGYNYQKSDPGRIEQATVLRDFTARAEAYGIDYNLIEAFDQPWKTNEGSVGAYWGVFDAVAAGQVRLDRADQRSGLRQGRGSRRPARAPAVAADPGEDPCDQSARPPPWRSPPTGSAPGLRSCSPSGTGTTSCPAPSLPSGSASCF